MEIIQKIDSGDYKISDASGSSDVWKYFRKIVIAKTGENVPHVICSNCGKTFKFGKGASSSNLKKHTCYKRHSNDETLSSPIKRTPINISEQLREDVLQNCVKFVYHDLQYIEVVNGEAFKALAQCLLDVGVQIGTENFSTDHILPNSTTISQRLQQLHLSEREKLIDEISPYIEKGMCASTLDVWADSRKRKNFIAFTVHYLDSKWRLEKRNLFTVEFEYCDDNGIAVRNTAENIMDAMELKFVELNLDKNLLENITFTTDQGLNIKKALQHHSSIKCIVHVLNIILKQTFDKAILQCHAPHILNLIAKCKSLLVNLKRTGKYQRLETNAQQACPITWSTTFEMLCSIHEHFNAIDDILEQSDELYRLKGFEQDLLDRLKAMYIRTI